MGWSGGTVLAGRSLRLTEQREDHALEIAASRGWSGWLGSWSPSSSRTACSPPSRVGSGPARGVAVGGDVDDRVDRPRDLALPVGRQRGLHAGQQRLARPPRDEHAVAEAEPRLVGGVEPVQLVGDPARSVAAAAAPAPGRSPAPRTRTTTRSPGGAPSRGCASISSTCSSSGIACAIALARSNMLLAPPNGRAATSLARNRGAPSNSGARAAAHASASRPSSVHAGPAAPGAPATLGAPIRRQPERGDQQRHVVAPRRVRHPQLDRDRREEALVAEDELERVRARLERGRAQQVADPAVGIGQASTMTSRDPPKGQAPQPDGRSPPRGTPVAVSRMWVEMVGRSEVTRRILRR